jgi:hypothetical protein
VWGGNKDPVHFQYPGFVVPAQDPIGSGLPWWAELAMPQKAVNLFGTPMEQKTRSAFHDWWASW